eukprot:TRINITY_DN4328_c0_g2_i2.p1 TRINITY_DN4328_c0_g2~~TRINITY_DN4328_c0_g2_i2.p1  ORF type:complete len:121 (+),score=15.84 TRINITY_DN4328_c0_g2_i2:151-513(+)
MLGRVALVLVLLALAVVVAGNGVVMELSYANGDCTGSNTVTNTWKLNTCSGVGNQPPYHVSENVSVDHLMAVFSYYVGPNCTGAPYEVSNQTLNKCQYFAGNTFTMFVHENSTGHQELRQ